MRPGFLGPSEGAAQPVQCNRWSLRFTNWGPRVSSCQEVETRANRVQARPEPIGRALRVGAVFLRKIRLLPILTTYGSFHQKAVLLKRINVIWSVHSHLQKYFRSSPKQITSLVAPSRSSKGRIAIVTDAERDAVDASSAADEQRLSGRRSRVVLMPRRWHQVGR